MPVRRVLSVWWPLAASWLLMSAEGPLLSAVIGRLADPEIHLAAYGSVVFPLALLIEAPIIMLLAASTALSKDWASYQRVRQYMMAAGAILTGLHILVAFTPLFYVVVRQIMHAPEGVIEPARLGLKIMLPWTWSIAYRRFNQGVLIRFGRSRAVGLGTVVRLSADILVVTAGYLLKTIPGTAVATSALAAGVLCEAVFAGLVVRPVLHGELKQAPLVEPSLSWGSFWKFYIPLAMTSLLSLLANPLGSAALGRMPEPLASLAAWPVVTGLIFMVRSLGIAFNEVVVTLLDEPHSYPTLLRFTQWLAVLSTLALLVIAATPLSSLWFQKVTNLSPHLVELSLTAMWIALPLPLISVLQSWYQGAILYSRHTRGITESVVIFLAVSMIILVAGVLLSQSAGLYTGMLAFTACSAAQAAWLWHRGKGVLKEVKQRDTFTLTKTAAVETAD